MSADNCKQLIMENKREYLIFEDVSSDASLNKLFDTCVTSILEGKARVSNTREEPEYPTYECFVVNGREILIDAPLEYYLFKLDNSGFVYEKARDFSDTMRKLCGWQWHVDTVLSDWVKRNIRDPFLERTIDNDGYDHYKLKPGKSIGQLQEDYLRFACYIGVCFVKYSGSEGQYTANNIFKMAKAMGSNLPAKLKKHGSSEIPVEITQYKDNIVSCDANDVFATIKITLKEEKEEAYLLVLNFLCRLLEFGFPGSYTINFKSPEKNWLPIKGLQKKGVHQLFANAVKWPALHEKIERYARLAMKEYEWYNDFEAEHCAVPGSFAVFSLGLLDEKYQALICDYLTICDEEHQSIQGEFVLAYIEKYGFTEKGLELYDLCEKNIQQLPKKLSVQHAKLN